MFVGLPPELEIKQSQGEFDNYTMALASYISDEEIFLGLKIWSLDFNIHPINEDQRFDFHNLEVLAFTKKGDLELRELTLQSEVSRKGDGVLVMLDQTYNLKLARHEQNGDNILVFYGVGYSNRTGFKADGIYQIGQPSSSPLHELNLTLTLSYARGPFGWYGTTKVSTSLKITVRE